MWELLELRLFYLSWRVGGKNKVMEFMTSNKNYLLLKNWWASIDLTNYEKSLLNNEIRNFNQQLFRLKEKRIRIGIYGKAGVGKSSILNFLLDKNVFKTNIINGSTKKVEIQEWGLNNRTLKSIDLLDSPGFDFCNIKFSDNIFSQINNSDLILFAVSGDINRNEVKEINSFINNGKKIIIIVNKIDIWHGNELKEIIKNINSKLPKEIKIPIIINSGNNIKNYIAEIINRYGEILLTLNSLQLADKLFLKIKEQRLKKRQREAQAIIGKFATIKASGVALNPLILFDIAGSFAIDTLLISELSKVYGFSLKGNSARKIIKNVSINNFFLGATQVGINTSFNILRKIILLMAPFSNGLSLLPYGPIAIIQAAIAMQSTKIVGKLAAQEIFMRSKPNPFEPSYLIKKIILKEPEIFNHIKIYLSKRNSKNIAIFLP